ncbi:YopX family protein [Pseudarthrobacter scleromae]|uniref:YopX family protein n=1 Tax=Pseudarthrobacter scleromae TaxID=158897 RepID=UPI003D033461
MSREIKLRAWIPQPENHMYTDEGGDRGPIMYYQDDQYLGSFLRRAGTMASSKAHDSYWEEKLELIQYTGLKDKNEQEIYEGDIVACVGGYEIGECEAASVIEWCDEELRYIARCVVHKDEVELNELDLDEVISNIYENPELL